MILIYFLLIHRQPSVTFDSAAASKQAKLLKRTRHDIEDKFCKFEIRVIQLLFKFYFVMFHRISSNYIYTNLQKLIEGDETISIYSDTWSTDVLASDSETIGESTYDRNFIITHFGQQISRSGNFFYFVSKSIFLQISINMYLYFQLVNRLHP